MSGQNPFFKIGYYGNRLIALVVMILSLIAVSVPGAPMDGVEATHTQPDGSVITVKYYGDEFYARGETVDGYTVIFDLPTKTFYYADLSPDGNELVSTGKAVGTVNPDAIGLAKHREINATSRAAKARACYEAHEAVVKQRERWEAVKAANRDYRAFQKQVREQEKAGKKGLAIPMGTLLPDSGSVSSVSSSMAPLASSASDGIVLASSGDVELLATPPQMLYTVLGLTILVDFFDEPGTNVIPSEVDDFCNKPGYDGFGNGGSVYDYFFIQSAGKLRYLNNVTYYVRVPQPKTYYNDMAVDPVTCGNRLLNDALDVLIANGYDFSRLSTTGDGKIRACNVFFAGSRSAGPSGGLWPHSSMLSTTGAKSVGGGRSVWQYQISNIGSSLTLGTFCHENGHMLLGYADYYDYDYDSEGMGNYSLMATGGYSTQQNPANIHGYLKWHSGWIDAVELYGATAPQRCAVRVDGDTIYTYTNPAKPQEYFMIENRSKFGWEARSDVSDSGLLITHNDEYGNRDYQQMTEAQHYECSVEQADGTFDLEHKENRGDAYDLFHAGGTGPATTFDDATLPNAKWWAGADGTAASGTASGLSIHSISEASAVMTFVFGAGAPEGSPGVGLDANRIWARCDSGQNAVSDTFSVFNAGGGTLDYAVTVDQPWLSCTPATGTASNETDAIMLDFDTSALAAGYHTATITVSDPAASPSDQTITVTLTVDPRPVLALSISQIVTNGLAGSVGPSVPVALRNGNTGGGRLNYAITNSHAWLTLSSASGTVIGETDSFSINLDATTLAAGSYSDTVVVTSAEATNAPLAIAVTFDVVGNEIVLTAPNGGEQFVAGTPLNITWDSSIGGSVAIDLLNGGVVGSVVTAATTNDGSYTWTIPPLLNGTNFTIRITSLDASPGFSDESSGAFSIALPPLYYANMDTDPDWTLDAGWAYGQPTGGNQDGRGNPDPTSGYNGSHVVGYRLDGDYEAGLTVTNWATTQAIDCRGYTNVTLRFRRWLGVERFQYDRACIAVSSNGTDWTTVWQNPNSDMAGGSWELASYNISAIADGQATVFVRWGMGTTDSSFQYCGWNLDEVELIGEFGGAAVVVTKSGGSLDVTEGGGEATYTLALYTAPTDAVVISITSDVQVTVDKPSVIFTAENWDVPQTVTVTAVDDTIHEGAHTGTITHTASSADPAYDGIGIADVRVNIADNDNNAPVVNAGLNQIVRVVWGTWSPLNANVSLWLDADDAATLVLNGEAVSVWQDKSGNGRDATQDAPDSQPTDNAAGLNGKHVLSFDGADDYLNIDLDFLASVSHSAFVVTRPTAYNNLYGAAEPGWDENSLHVGFNSDTDYRMNYWYDDWVGPISVNFRADSANLLNYVWTSGVDKEIFANGSSEGTSGSAGVIGTMAGGGRISNVVDQGCYGGDIAEIIMVTGEVDVATRETIEGYLAHKWGLESYLPDGHTYKTESPSGGSTVVNLAGAVSDADADPVSTLWTVVSGPGPVAFADTNAVETVATFTVEGVYTLRLTATDGIAEQMDDVVITITSHLLTDYETWLIDAYGTTNVDANAMSSNGVNTILESYIIGLDPTDPAGRFEVSGLGTVGGGAVLSWQSESGRLYNVYWSSNLLGGTGSFQLLASNVSWNASSFTDTVHNAENMGFYRIDVRLAE